jgi:hypothetical protein
MDGWTDAIVLLLGWCNLRKWVTSTDYRDGPFGLGNNYNLGRKSHALTTPPNRVRTDFPPHAHAYLIFFWQKKLLYYTCTGQQNLVSHHIMEPRFSTNWMLHWTPHITSSFIYISWRYGFTDGTTTGVIAVKEAKNSSTYSRLYQRQEEAPPSGRMGCPFSTSWGLQQK